MSVEELIKKHWKELRKKANVNGYSATLKPKIIGGVEHPEIQCIRIYVIRKLPEAQLKKEDIIPKEIEGIKTDVVEIGEMKALSIDKTKKFRPAPAGVSIGHPDITAGTLGWFGRDKSTKEMLIISNNHVLANENKATIGDPELQPGKYDGGTYPNDLIGTLYRFVPIQFEEYVCPFRNALHKFLKSLGILAEIENLVDIAAAKPTRPQDIESKIVDIGEVKGKRLPAIGEQAQKSGRTTCHTTNGIVSDLDWSGYVIYSRGSAFFTSQILIAGSGFCAGGDSGSLILDINKNATAWLFAGSETYTIGNKIQNVEKLLEIELLVI